MNDEATKLVEGLRDWREELAAATEQLKCFREELKMANQCLSIRKRVAVDESRPEALEHYVCGCCVCHAHRNGE